MLNRILSNEQDSKTINVVMLRRFGTRRKSEKIFDGLAVIGKNKSIRIEFKIDVLFTKKSEYGKYCDYSLSFRKVAEDPDLVDKNKDSEETMEGD